MQNTFLGHIYVARDADSDETPKAVVDWWAMNGGPHPIRDRRKEVEEACAAQAEANGEAGTCLDAEQASFNFIYQTSFTKRHALNTVQPAVAHNYSDVGYVKMKMPEEVS